jgi:hypothetical protein
MHDIKYRDGEKNPSRDFKGSARFQHPRIPIRGFWNAVCLSCECMYEYVRLAGAERLDGLYSYTRIPTALCITGRCPVNTNIPASKIGVLQIGPVKQNGDVLENGFNNFFYISVICGDHRPKYRRTDGTFRKITTNSGGPDGYATHTCPPITTSTTTTTTILLPVS